MNSILQDLRFAVRQHRRKPFFSLTVILTLALSIGATAALTGVPRATLLHPLPYPEAQRLVTPNPAPSAWDICTPCASR